MMPKRESRDASARCRGPGPVALCLLAACLAITGCAKPGRAPTAKAAGALSAGGAPLAGVNVTFTPAAGRSASGTTDAEGRFSLSTFAPGDGAVPGKHRVTLSLKEADVPMPGTPEAAAYKPPPLPFAKKYAGLATTDLEIEIPPGGNPAIALEVAKP
jgi:hypothetical protein